VASLKNMISRKANPASREHQKQVGRIVDLSLRILGKMFDEESFRFCYLIGKDSPSDRVPSFRYTAITLIGLSAARAHGVPVAFPLDDICTDLAIHAPAEIDLGNKAVALWAALSLKSRTADSTLAAILSHDSFVANADEGLIRSTELAWAVYSLALARLDMMTDGGGILSRGTKDIVRKRLVKGVEVLRSQRHPKTGLFAHASMPNGNARLRDKMKAMSGFFDSQVYGAMALARSASALERFDLLREANETVQAILSLQGTNGEWPWHYDVLSGAIIDMYPIFSVHQDGMGPMVLLEVGESLGVDFQPAVERSLQWVFGKNELNVSMIDSDLEIIWRGLERKGMRRYIHQGSRLLHYYGLLFAARWLKAIPGTAIIYECRPYHLGWLLYAFCRPSQLPDVGQG
jgi:hypothetical protein